MAEKTSFREKQKPAKEPVTEANNKTTVSETRVEVPYTDYEKEHGKPFTAEHFQLGETWDDPNGGFAPELSLIEEFVDDRIKKGELPNNVDSVKDAFKKMEKTIGLDKNERPLVKIEMLASYVKFLMECDKIKFNVGRYGNNQG